MRFFLERLLRCSHFFRKAWVYAFILLLSIQTGVWASAPDFKNKEPEKRQEQSLRLAVDILKKQTGYSFFFKENEVDLKTMVPLVKQGVGLEQNLKQILKGTKYDFKIIKKQVVIFLKNVTDDKASGQSKYKLRGTVSDAEDGEGIPGVTVRVKNTTRGANTDISGRYELEVNEGEILIFSYVGYIDQEIAVGSRTVIDVALSANVKELDEVVVTAFGLKREKKAVTYAAQQVQAEDMRKARSANVLNTLSGKVAGLTVSRGGTGVGSASKVILRGNRSISGSSQPIYIVDGMILNGDISNISPDDIESYNVLKGANAAALYGSRAANGAIVITTKSGNSGGKKYKVTLNTTYTMEEANVLMDYQNEYGQGFDGVYNAHAADSWGAKFDGSTVPHWSLAPGAPSEYRYVAQPDNVTDFFQTGHNFATNVGVASSGEVTDSYFSYTFTDAAGTVPNNELEGHNLNLRMTQRLGKVTVESKLNYIRQILDNQLYLGGGTPLNPIRQALRFPRNIRTQDAEQFEYFDETGERRQNFWKPGHNGSENPYWVTNRVLNNTLRERVLGFVSAKYQITDYLSLMARSSLDRTSDQREDKLYNDTYIRAPEGDFMTDNRVESQWNTDFLMNFNKDFNDWSVNANFGGNLSVDKYKGVRTANTQLNAANVFAISNAKNLIGSEVFAEKEVQSLYGFAQIGYKNAVFLDLTARNDWSSTLPEGNNSFFYPSVGLTVVASDLLPKLPDFLSFLKFRGSWAEVGNDTSPYRSQRTLSLQPGGVMQLDNVLPVSDLLPETTRSTELGFDMRLFENRIGFDFTWYKTNSFDQLFSTSLPVGSGASFKFLNGADIENRGVEMMLSATPIKGDFTWDIRLNYATNDSEVVELAEGFQSIAIGSADNYMTNARLDVGEPFGSVYGKGFKRDKNGNVIVGQNGIPLITEGKSVRVANFNPDWTGGIYNNFKYKNFNLSFLIDIRQGGDVVSYTSAVLAQEGLTEETLAGREGGLVFGENVFGGYSAVTEDGSPNTIQTNAQSFWKTMGNWTAPVGEAFIRDASNIRLRELVFGYRLPSKILKKTPFESVNVSLVGRNLFFISNKAGDLDPEVQVNQDNTGDGFSSFAPPTSRSYGFNLNISF
ncbi:SusC/RagA family TonB-linked outer membrane protein [Fulvitalea axinellae]